MARLSSSGSTRRLGCRRTFSWFSRSNRHLRLGYLKRGDRLPKVREVVAELAINPNTVLKAYRELENKGLTSGRPGQGTFIDGSLEQANAPAVGRVAAFPS